MSLNLYRALLETQKQTGIVVLADDSCCRLLAWLSELGGSYEQTVIDGLLHEDLLEAQKRLNVFGGERPNSKLTLVFINYTNEIKETVKKKNTYPDWVYVLHRKYKLPEPKIYGKP